MSKSIWITGLPGTGKSTIAKKTAELTDSHVLEMDKIRKIITPEPRYTKDERDIAYRSLAYMAYLIHSQGKDVIIDGTDNTGSGRETAKKLIPNLSVVQLECDSETVRRREDARDDKNLYKKADSKEINLPGVTASYYREEKPLIVIDTSTTTPEDAAQKIHKIIFKQ